MLPLQVYWIFYKTNHRLLRKVPNTINPAQLAYLILLNFAFRLHSASFNTHCHLIAQLVKNLSATQETLVGFLGWEDLLEKGMAPHSSILVWKITWTVKSMGSQRVEHHWATCTFIFTIALELGITNRWRTWFAGKEN